MQTSAFNPGDIIYNPVTRETIMWLQPAGQNNGAFTRFQLCVKVGGFGSYGRHIRPQQSQWISVVQGAMRITVDDKETVLQAGESLRVPPDVPFAWRNEGLQNLKAVVEIRPALHFEYLTATTFALAQRGKMAADGTLNLLYCALYPPRIMREVYPAEEPRWAVETTLTLLRPVAYLLGLRLPPMPTPEASSVAPAT